MGLFQYADGNSAFLIHVCIVSSCILVVNGLGTPVPTPQTRNAPYIPTAEAEGFTAQSDKTAPIGDRGT